MHKVVSLFAGCGGAECGMLGGFTFNGQEYPNLPFKLVYALDIDQKALDTHKLNFNCGEVICEDIRNIDEDTIPDHDVLIGGFPCQSFSTVNPTKDPFDERANLYKEMVRIVRAKQPKVFIAENVKGFMTLYRGKIIKLVREAFEEAGYTISTTLIKASEYGVPQRRERVIMVGIRNDLIKKLSLIHI